MSDPVMIAGAGPTGLTAALELSRLGIPVRIIDKLPHPRTTSRAIGVQARTLELLAQRGLADELVRLGHKAHGASLHGEGRCLTRLDLSRVPSPYNFTLLVAQSETERVLGEAVARQGVTVERGVELVGVAQNALSQEPSPVRAVLRHADGTLEEADAPWLISAEGAHSLTRTTLDLQFEGKTLDTTFALGDVRMEGELPETDFHAFSSEHGSLILFPFGGGRVRLVASDPPEKGSEPTLAELQQVWDQRSHVPARLHDLTWASFFRVNSRMVSHLKVGRLLLGGDAAHVHSPAGGQGMNTGIQDMINLGWKLAAVVQGRSPPELLDTYGDDRLPVMREVLFTTEGMTEMVGSEQPLVRGLFNHLMPLVGSAGFVQANATARMSQVALGYRGSPMSENHGPAGHLHAGDRAPPIRVRTKQAGGWVERGLLELLDPSRWTLLVVGDEKAAETDHASACGPARDLFDVRAVTEPDAGDDAAQFGAAFGRHGVLLVRPDGYVGFASGKAGVHNLARYTRRWLATEAGDVPS